MIYKYPLQIRFKILTFAPQISVTDNGGKEILYIEQKVFALREAVKIYNNGQEKKQLYGIKTQQVIDFGAQYYFYQGTDEIAPTGSIKEEGLQTLFKATYTILDKDDNPEFTITETNPWIKVADYILSLIPYLGMVTGYFLHPTYQVVDATSKKLIMRLQKTPSFWERQFRIDMIEKGLSKENEIMCILGMLMLIQLQKSRG